MADSPSSPLRVLSLFPIYAAGTWPGETPVDIVVEPDSAKHAALLPAIEVLISQVFTRSMAANAGALKLIQSTGAGVELIDFAAVPAGVPVAIVFEHEAAIGEWVIMAMIALNRQVLTADRDLRQGNWALSYFRKSFAPELGGQTLAIIGLGHIGRQAARLARAFGMRVIAATRTVPPAAESAAFGLDTVVGIDDRGTVMGQADFVLIATAASPQTEGLIGAAELAQMRPTAHLINVSRAGLVDEQALYQALKSGAIGGAALDVWYREPQAPGQTPMPANLPFWELDNVLMSPHLSGLTTDMWRRRVEFIAANIDRLARGEALLNVIHPG